MELQNRYTIRFDEKMNKQIRKFVDKNPHVWPTESQFIRSAVFWFVREMADTLAKHEKELYRRE